MSGFEAGHGFADFPTFFFNDLGIFLFSKGCQDWTKR
jgi:hypothetical protein